jgi:cell division protein FtsB
MSIGRFIRRKITAAAPPVVFLCVAGYFIWHGTQGDRGLNAMAQREQDLSFANSQLERANTDLKIWDRRVASLRANRLDRDALDERARAMLNLSDPADIVVMYGQNQKLF